MCTSTRRGRFVANRSFQIGLLDVGLILFSRLVSTVQVTATLSNDFYRRYPIISSLATVVKWKDTGVVTYFKIKFRKNKKNFLI